MTRAVTPVGIWATAVCAVIAASIAFPFGWHGIDGDPPSPAPACSMVRTELLDRVAPGHTTPVDETFGVPGMRGTACTVEFPGSEASIDIAVMNFARRDGRDPIRAAQYGMFAPTHPHITGFLRLGDQAWYIVSGNNTLYVVARVGATVAQITYQKVPLPPETVLPAATALAQEVLAQP